MGSDNYIFSKQTRDRLIRRGVTLSNAALLAGVAGIALGESFLFFGDPSLALTGHVTTLLFVVFAPFWLREETEVFGALALVSVLRVVTIGMPVFLELTLYWLPLVYAPFLPGLYLLGRIDGIVAVPLGAVTGLKLAPFAVPLGVVLAEVEYRVLGPETLLPGLSPLDYGLLVVVMVFLVAPVEEYLFRGLLQRSLSARTGWLPGVFLASVLFGLSRAVHGIAPGLVVSFGIGVVVGVLYDSTDSLTFVILVHGTLNVVLFGVLPIHGSFLP